MPFDAGDPQAIRHLLQHLSRAYNACLRARLGHVGLPRAQLTVMVQLWKRDGQTPGELVEECRVAPSTMSRTLDRLDDAGFIERRTDPVDRRVVRVMLTEAGRASEETVDQADRELQKTMLADMTDAERAIMRRLLIRAVDNVEAALREET